VSITPAELSDELTDEQLEVVEAPASARLLVTAGPGAGKTHVLIARLAALIEEGVSPGHGILVLSFSRAAVGEIRKRVADSGGNVRFVRARTFDSFATRLLIALRPEAEWQSAGYDERIRRASALIRAGDADDELRDFEHVLVDEIQDLVGDRADLVKAILGRIECGFTLFGDPAQGIYNFQLEGVSRAVGSLALFQWLRDDFKDLGECRLSRNFRAQTEEASRALWAGGELNGHAPDYEDIRRRLEDTLLELPPFTLLADAAPMLRSSRTPVAILCRTNGQALLISRELFELGVPHRLQREATDRAVAPWVGVALCGIDRNVVGRSEVEARLADLPELGDLDPERAWRVLKRLDRRPGDNLELSRIRERLQAGDVPDDLTKPVEASVVVSTVHRAKGLEFHRVIFVDPSGDPEDEMEAAEEVRVIYVALTRPTHELYHVPSPDTRRMRSKGNPDERWVQRGYKYWQIRDVEVRGGDIDRAFPPGTFVFDADARELQRYLRSDVANGDPVTLRLQKSNGRAFYLVEHDGRAIAVTSEVFGGILFAILKINRGWEVNWPVRIEGLHVESLDTVAGSEAASRSAGLGSAGIWLRPRIFGLGTLVFQRLDEARA